MLSNLYSFRSCDSLTVPRFDTDYVKNSIACREATPSSAVASKDKNYASIKCNDFKQKLNSMEIFSNFNFNIISGFMIF